MQKLCAGRWSISASTANFHIGWPTANYSASTTNYRSLGVRAIAANAPTLSPHWRINLILVSICKGLI